MRTFDDADSAARAYLEVTERLEAPRSLGLVVGQACRHCGSGPCTEKGGGWNPRKKQRKPVERVCLACGKAWEGEDVLDRSRSGGWSDRYEEELGRYHHLRPVIEGRPRDRTHAQWRWILHVFFAYLDPRIGSYANVLAWGRGEYTVYRPADGEAREIRLPPPPLEELPWTEHHIRGAVREARRIIEARLARKRG